MASGSQPLSDEQMRRTWALVDLLTSLKRRANHPPPTADGSLAMDSEESYPVHSLARFNDLIKHEGPGRYRLRFHVTPSPTTKTARPGSASFNFSLTNSQTSVTRMLWYFYFSGPGRTRPGEP